MLCILNNCIWNCWGWLIEKRVDEFVIEKYIEINKDINIMYKFYDTIRKDDMEHVHIFIANDTNKKLIS